MRGQATPGDRVHHTVDLTRPEISGQILGRGAQGCLSSLKEGTCRLLNSDERTHGEHGFSACGGAVEGWCNTKQNSQGSWLATGKAGFLAARDGHLEETRGQTTLEGTFPRKNWVFRNFLTLSWVFLYSR